MTAVTRHASVKWLDFTSFVSVSKIHKRIFVRVVGSDGFFRENLIDLNFLSVCVIETLIWRVFNCCATN